MNLKLKFSDLRLLSFSKGNLFFFFFEWRKLGVPQWHLYENDRNGAKGYKCIEVTGSKKAESDNYQVVYLKLDWDLLNNLILILVFYDIEPLQTQKINFKRWGFPLSQPICTSQIERFNL